MSPGPSEILLIFKTHLDIGFTGFARDVVRQYMEQDIPAALRLARETRASAHRFVWTTGSWIAYRFLEDAPRAQRRAMEEAIEAGDFHWHALPFTMHSELLDPALYRLGLRFSEILDRRFGRKTIAAKMTDVPGHTRGIVPQLAARGIRLLHIGTNPASSVPGVPPMFLWKAGGAELVVLYEKEYGGTALLPRGKALSMNLTNDNLGPQNPAAIAAVYENLAARFPKARLTAGSLDLAARWLWPLRHTLPVVTDEIGDTWIHGAGTDPEKLARFRALSRLRAGWIASGSLEEGGPEDLAFGENLLLVAEHTWGMDIKTHLADWRVYSPAALRRSLDKPNFRKVAASWQEQRDYLTAAVRALSAPRRREAQRRLRELKPAVPPRSGARRLSPSATVRLGPWELRLDPRDGSLCFLRDTGGKRLLADARHPLAAFAYQTFSKADYARFLRQYSTLDADWARKDFTKPGLPATAPSAWHVPRLERLALRGDSLEAELRFEASARRFGAPRRSLLTFAAADHGLDIRLEWFEKPANRMPEAFWLKFAPRPLRGAPFTLEKTGLPLDPRQVVRNGNRHLHAVTGPVECAGLSIRSLDAILAAPGKPSLLDFNQTQPAPGEGVSFNLYNNAWGTNFPMWYAQDALFRFELRPGRPL
ncbi:MAG: DUF5054 domain-containing protein [Chthoniobacteraceae bacterium]|nr:DUF5054 domain-containing protein [Chthoniobacteraceae bacterium]